MYIQPDSSGIIRVSADKSWRLVHDGVKAYILEEQDFAFETGGNSKVFVAPTKYDCDVEISNLKLVLDLAEQKKPERPQVKR